MTDKRLRAAFDAVNRALNGKGDVAPSASSEFYTYLADEVLAVSDRFATGRFRWSHLGRSYRKALRRIEALEARERQLIAVCDDADRRCASYIVGGRLPALLSTIQIREILEAES